MTTPTVVGQALLSAGGSFGSSATGSVNVGGDPVSLYALSVVYANAGNTQPASTITVSQGGSPVGTMTRLFTPRSLGVDIGLNGRWTGHKLEASGLTGTLDLSMAAVLVSDDTTSDGNGKPVIVLAWVKDNPSATHSVRQAFISAGADLTASAAGATGDLMLAILISDLASAPTPVAGTTQIVYGGAVEANRLMLSAAGGAGGNVATTNTSGFGCGYCGLAMNLVQSSGGGGGGGGLSRKRNRRRKFFLSILNH